MKDPIRSAIMAGLLPTMPAQTTVSTPMPPSSVLTATSNVGIGQSCVEGPICTFGNLSAPSRSHRPSMPRIRAGLRMSRSSPISSASSIVNGSMLGWIRLRSMRSARADASSNLNIRNFGRTNSK